MHAFARTAALALALQFPLLAHAIHFDVKVGLDGPVSTPGSQLTTGFFGDLPITTLPVDTLTGYNVFPGDFGDFEGGPRATDDPGFQSFAGALAAGDVLGYRALGTLQQWDAVSDTWSDAQAGIGIRLYGGAPPAVAEAYLTYLMMPQYAPPNALANYQYYMNGTLFSGTGISGPDAAFIDGASSSGTFHTHFDFFIEGAAPATAYMITLQLTDDAVIGGRGLYEDSEPFHIVFNYGLSQAQYDAAFLSRVTPAVPEPSAAAMLALGLGLLALARRRVRS